MATEKIVVVQTNGETTEFFTDTVEAKMITKPYQLPEVVLRFIASDVQTFPAIKSNFMQNICDNAN